MGFYGNVTASAKTNLQVDKHYATRAEMDSKAASDGVYAGRYVMVEYSLSTSLSSLPLLYEAEEVFYNAPSRTEQNKVTSFTPGILYRVIPAADWQKEIGSSYEYILYVAASKTQLVRSSSASDSTGFTTNFLADQVIYAPNNTAFKGYDSTIWQKIYEKGKATYVNIAELNSVIPSFGITVDAPSVIPTAPHFDQTHTNVYYDIHLQPQWGFRIAAADNRDSSYKGGAMKSNVKIDWNTVQEDGSIETASGIDGAIYFNQAGFDSTKKSKDTTSSEDFISLTPTGKSLRKYNTGEGYGESNIPYAQTEDMQELRINLPSIGNMMSDAWDIIHGPERDDSTTDSLQGRLDFFTKEIGDNQIPIQTTRGGNLVGATFTGDTWLAPEVDASNKTITIVHKDAHDDPTNKTAGKTESVVTDFKGVFSVPYIKYDEKGHIVSHGTRDITLPDFVVGITSSGSGSASVLTSIGYDNPNNTVTTTKQDVGTLLMTGYSTSGVSAAAVANTDTLNQALAKLQVNLEGERTRINNMDYADSNGASGSNVATKITQTDGKIAVTHANIGTLKITGYDTSSASAAALAATDTLNGALAKLQLSLNAEVTRATAAEKTLTDTIDALDVSDSASGSNVITVVSQTNGKIAVTHANVGTIKLAGYSIASSASDISTADSINSAFGKVQRKLTDLTSTINNLDFSDTNTVNNVVVKVDQSNGLITTTHTNVGSLKLSGYSLPSNVDNNGKLSTSHSINDALGRLEFRLNATDDYAQNTLKSSITALQNTIDGLDYTDTENNTKIITQVSQTNGKIAVTRANAGTLTLATYTTPTGGVIAQGTNLEGAFNLLDAALVTEKTRATTAETALGKRIDDILDGVTEAELNTFKELSAALNNDSDFATNVNKSIAANTDAIAAVNTSLANYHTKTEVTSLLNNYATKAELPTDFYSKADTYTKTEVTALIADITKSFSIAANGETINGTTQELLTKLLERVQALEAYHAAT